MIDELDFLAPQAPPLAVAAAAAEPLAGEIVVWSASAWVSRDPEARPCRGVKGLLACRRDLDRHLKRLLSCARSGDETGLRSYGRWAVAVMARRGTAPEVVHRGVAVLEEALKRHMRHPDGEILALALADAFFHDDRETGAPRRASE